jgi:hypothetical protein
MVSIQPYPIDQCMVTFRHEGSEFPSVHEGDLFVPTIPGLPVDALKFLVKTQSFSLVISMQGEFSFEQSESLYAQNHPPRYWAELARTYCSFSFGKVEVEIRSRKRSRQVFLGRIENKLLDVDLEACKQWLELCQRTETLYKRAGVPPEVGLRIDDIRDNAREIVEASAFLGGEVNRLFLKTSKPPGFPSCKQARTLFVSFVKMGKIVIGYSAIINLSVQFEEDHVFWRSCQLSPGQARWLGATANEFMTFVEDTRAAAETDFLVIQRVPDKTSMEAS